MEKKKADSIFPGQHFKTVTVYINSNNAETYVQLRFELLEHSD